MLTKRRPIRSSAQLPRLHNKLAASKSTEHFTNSSPKSCQLTFRNNLRRAKQHTKPNSSPLILIVPDQQLSTILKQYPLRHTILSNEIKTNQEIRHQVVLSSIEQFSQYYGKVLKQIGRTECKIEWLMICKAVNSQQLQNELNRRYQTFIFVLLPSLLSAINRINNYGQTYGMSCVGWQYFRKIVNWSALDSGSDGLDDGIDGFNNSNAGILEQTIQNLAGYEVKQKQLWIISLSMIGHFKQRQFNYYFLDQFAIQQAKIKIKSTTEHIVFVIVTGSTKIYDILNTIPDTQHALKHNLVTANSRYLKKLSNKLKQSVIHCLINFPKPLVHRFNQRQQYFITADQPLRINQLNLACIHYGETSLPSFQVVQFDTNACQQDQMERVLCVCKEWKHIQLQYYQLKMKLNDYQLALLHIAGNQQLHIELQYFLSTTIPVIQQIRSVFQVVSDRRVVLFGRFSKIQTDSLHKLPHLSMVNLKHIDQTAQTKHHHIILAIQQAITPNIISQKKTVTFFEQHTLHQQPNFRCISRMISSQISPKISQQDSQTRCHSAPTLYQSSNQIYIAVPRTVPHHSLVSRSVIPYFLLLYGSIEEVRQLTKYVQTKTTLYILMTHRQRKFIDKHSNVQVIAINQLTEKAMREHIDFIIQREQLQIKKGRIMKPKKGLSAAVVYDQTNIEQIKQIDLVKSIFPQGKPITITHRELNQLTAQFSICELAVYQLGHQHLKQSTQIATLFHLFTIYMNPIHSHSIQLSTQHLNLSNRLLWLKHCKETCKQDRLKGKVNDVSINRLQSPRNRSFKNIDLYTTQNGITILHNTISFSKISKTHHFKSQQELISLIFNQQNKGNHSAVALTQHEYHQMRQLCEMKIDGILWIVTTSNQHLCTVRQPTLIFCLSAQLQSVVLEVTEHFRRSKNKQFQMQQSVGMLNISEDRNRVMVYCYGKWRDYVQQRQAKYMAETINLVKYSPLEQIQIADMRYAIFCDEHTFNLTLLHNPKSQPSSRFQKQLDEESAQMVFILLHSKHIELVKQSLQMIGQANYTLITYNQIEQLLLYGQLTKTITILQAKQKIRIGSCLWLQQEDTASDFKYKLAAYIQSVRIST